MAVTEPAPRIAVREPGPTPARPWTGMRVVAVVVASTAVLAATGLLAGAMTLLAAHAFMRDADGYYGSASERVETTTYAVTAEGLEPMDVGGGVTGRLLEHTAGRVRIRAAVPSGGRIFVGIARERDLDSWLAPMAHEELTDVRFEPFSYDSVRHIGTALPGRPGDQRFWAASVAGAGQRALEWKVRPGRWGVVVMNADGHRGVHADVQVGAAPRLVLPIALGMLVAALLVLAPAAAGLRASLRERSR
jgi:hypothetical protein